MYHTDMKSEVSLSKRCRTELGIDSKNLAEKMGLPKSTLYSWWKSPERHHLIEMFIELYAQFQKSSQLQSLLFETYMTMDHGTNDQRLKQLEKLESFFKSEHKSSSPLTRKTK